MHLCEHLSWHFLSFLNRKASQHIFPSKEKVKPLYSLFFCVLIRKGVVYFIWLASLEPRVLPTLTEFYRVPFTNQFPKYEDLNDGPAP